MGGLTGIGRGMSKPLVAIVGRPNVGKSTLFNRMIGFRKAVVHDRPGVTRDRIYEDAEGLRRNYIVMDTGGLEPRPDTSLLEAMRLQSLVALEEANVIIFLVDGRAGYTPGDTEVADLLRRSQVPVILAVNKIDGAKHEDLGVEFYEIGMDPMFTISAEHGRGVYELLEAVEERLPPAEAEESDDLETEQQEESEIRIAVLGRPNIGKSTLINKLLGEERHLVHDAPGTTMDPVDSLLEVDGKQYLLVDTAGVRRKSRINDGLERFVSLRSIKAIERCHACLLVIDATEGITDQDARLAQLINERGRALIILFNKWDLTKDLEDISSFKVEDMKETKLPHASWASHLFISAKTGKGVGRILGIVNDAYREFDKRVSTSELNRWLEITLDANTPPQRYHRPVRIYYVTQTRVRPPTFAFYSNSPEGIAAAYRRYLANKLRKSFGFGGTPLRLDFKRRRKLGEEKEAG